MHVGLNRPQIPLMQSSEEGTIGSLANEWLLLRKVLTLGPLSSAFVSFEECCTETDFEFEFSDESLKGNRGHKTNKFDLFQHWSKRVKNGDPES